MAHGAVRNYWTSQDDWQLFEPLHAGIIKARDALTRQNYYTLRVQAAVRRDIDLSSSFTIATASVYSLAQYSNIIFGLKESATDTDFAAAWAGFNTGDTAWHSLANGRASIDVAPTTALDIGDYVGVFRFLDGTSYLDVPASGLIVSLRQNIITGSEPSTPGGTTDNDGTATILAGSDTTGAITDANMTTGGLVIPFFLGNPVSSIGATCANGSFTISIGGPAASNLTVGYYIRKRS